MRNKASLVLMEQLIMVLVFAIAAAVCLGIFAQSTKISQENERQEKAMMLARNAVQYLKDGRDPRELDTGELSLHIQQLSSNVPGYLQTAQVSISFQNQELCTLVTGWQEVAP